MVEDKCSLRDGPFGRDEMGAWVKTLEEAYPCETERNDSSVTMILESLKHEIGFNTPFHFIFYFDGSLPVGMIKYVSVDNDRRIELHHFAVLPSHQRQSIGTKLLEKIKAKASGRASIFASGILEPAHRPLQKAGFWRVKKRKGEPAYKWSDLPDQQNDETPEADEIQVE